MTERNIASHASLNLALDTLANTYRRRLLMSLLQDDDLQLPADVEIRDKNFQQLHIQIIHIHLPKLEDVGFIQCDQDTNQVRRGPRFGEIQPLLQLMRDHADNLPGDWA